jgi:hypothetical protein
MHDTLRIALVVLLGHCCFAAAGEVAFTVTEPSGVDRVDWPVTSGIPFARGEVQQTEHIALYDDLGRELSLQTEVLARWPDGSIRWLLLDFQTGLMAAQTKPFTLRFGVDVHRANVTNPVRVIQGDHKVVVNSGPLQIQLSARQFRLFDDVRLDLDGDGDCEADEQITASDEAGLVLTAPDGEAFRADQGPAKIVVEEAGPLRACVRIEGAHHAGEQRMFRYIVRLHAYRRKPFVKVHYTFVNDHEALLMTKIKSLDLHVSLAQRLEPENLLNRAAVVESRLFQVDDEHFQIDGHDAGRRSAGWAAISDEHYGVAVGVREFWQNWPKGLAVAPGRLQIGLCPEFVAGIYDGKPLAEECQHSYYLRDGAYSFKIGVSRTQELWANFLAGRPDAGPLDEFFRAAEQPLVAQCTPQRIAETKAIGQTPPADGERYHGYDLLVEEMFDEHLRDRDRVREYGMLNFGDWYNTAWDSWGNLEYDTARIWFTQYHRTGDRRYFNRAEQAARHYLDVDVAHAVNAEVRAYPGSSQMRVGQVWAHSVGHTGGYYARWIKDHYEDEASLKQKGAPQMGFWDHGHAWVGGVFDYYFLTGDRRAKEVALLVSDTMAEFCPTPYTDHIRWIGWPFHMMLSAYDATGDKRYLDAATKQWQMLKSNFDPQQGFPVLLAYGHCNEEAESKRCRGQNMYMLGFTLTALARYHRVTNDPDVLTALSAGIDQMIREAWSEAHQSFYLTSCVHQRNSPPPGFCSATFHASEAFAYESALTGNGEHRRIMRVALQSAIQAGRQSIAAGESCGQTGYASGVFHFAPFALPLLEP